MSPTVETTKPPRPLEGIRVFELSIAIAGPVCGRYLAHFGAEVIKVESLKNPDVIRLLGSGWLARDRHGLQAWGDCGPYVNEMMTGKRSLGLDLKSRAGLDAAKRLLEKCDVFISNYSAPAVVALGLDYESVRAVKPDIVYAGISGFGSDPAAPYYDFIAWGPNQGPLVGLDDLTGWPDRPPAGVVTIAYPDYTNGIHAAIAVLAALEHRDRSGEGQLIDMSQQEATVALFGSALLECELTEGATPRRSGNRHPRAAPHGIYPCRGRERWVAISVFNDVEWRALCGVAKAPQWADDPRFRTLEDRLANQDSLDEIIAAWTCGRFDTEVSEWLQRVGVAAAPVLDDPRVATDPQLEARGFWILADHHHYRKDLATGNPIHLDDTPGFVERAGPSLGEDNDYALGHVCGYSAPEIQRLVDCGAVFPMIADVRLERPYLRWIRHFLPTLDWPETSK
jgi:crotonobetainyl-CoA:carnitine CoA-transferase CaiB-like acyl-CoA transferase